MKRASGYSLTKKSCSAWSAARRPVARFRRLDGRYRRVNIDSAPLIPGEEADISPAGGGG
jgi:hypothetical protein